MAVYEFPIFNRRGDCLLHEDYTNTQPMHDKRVMKERQKLVFGLLWSLREFSKMISPGPLVTFNNYFCLGSSCLWIHAMSPSLVSLRFH